MFTNPSRARRWMVAVAVLGATVSCLAQYGGGTGEPNDPYLIYTAEQMNTIGTRPADWTKHFRLMADLDLAAYTGTQFNIIAGNALGVRGGPPKSFDGVFDGNDHVISNFSHNSKGRRYVGLFGYLGDRDAQIRNLGLISPIVAVEGGLGIGALVGNMSEGTIAHCYVVGGSVTGDQRVGGLLGGAPFVTYESFGVIDQCYVEDCHVTGKELVGSLVGENSAIVTNCYASGRVTGVLHTGGLVGYNDEGTLINCYAVVNTVGEQGVGGLAGYNRGSIKDCYATGAVAGTSLAGGLVGDGPAADTLVTNSFWDRQTSGQTAGPGQGRTTAEMQDPAMFAAAGWEVWGYSNDPSAIWTMSPDTGYPIFWYQVAEAQQPPLPIFSGGTGTPGDPYLISSAQQLNSLAHNPRLMTAHFKLVNDLDLTGVELFCIGTEAVPFAGVFDGNGKSIIDFTHTSARGSHIGVFGYVRGKDARILNLDLLWPNVDTRGWYVGSLAGYLSQATITNCHARGGTISGGWSVGGLVGRNELVIIEDCSATANVTGDLGVGGLVGDVSGRITNCRAMGAVAGVEYVGGLAGMGHDSLITGSYATGPVTGGEYTGGLVGSNGGEILNSHAQGEVVGENETGGLVGVNGGDVTSSYGASQPSDEESTGPRSGHIGGCYATGAVTGASRTGGLAGFNWCGDVNESYATGDVNGTDEVGGLTGRSEYLCTITNCHAAGAISGQNSVGGLVGYSTNNRTIAKCRATGAVSGLTNVGGLAGFSDRYCEIADCYATGGVWAQENVGGLVGRNGALIDTSDPGQPRSFIMNCYSIGRVSGNAHVGGLVGLQGSGLVRTSFWDVETSGQAGSDGGQGKTTAEMQDAGTFRAVLWDFMGEADDGTEDIWWILDGQDYPRLWWERLEDDAQP